MLGDKYRIQINVPGKGLSDTAFVNNILEWSFEKEEGQIYYRKKISTPLIFRDDTDLNKSDFTDLYKQERSRASRCDKIDLIVFKKCIGGAETQYWNGYLSMIDGKWNKSACEVEIVPRPQDQYTCLYENWERDISLLSLAIEKQTARSTVGVIEYKTCIREHSFIEPRCVSTEQQTTQGWTLVYWRVVPGGDDGDYEETRWAREVVYGPQPGPDFVLDGGAWVRSVHVVETDPDFNTNDAGVIVRQWVIVQYTLKNGLILNDVLLGMVRDLSPCQYTLVSNFFGIAPDGTAPTNRAYSKAFDHVRSLQVYEKSDVKRWNSDEPASNNKLNVSFKRMIENLSALFNVAFIIEEDTQKIRLEHISYFQDRRMLDLTQERFSDDIAGKWKYSYIKESIPIKEHFEFMESNLYNFDGLPIVYEATCSNDDKRTNEITIRADFVSTNVDSIVFLTGQTDNTDNRGLVSQSDNYTNDGMVFVEVAPTGYIVAALNSLYNTAERNNNLSWPNLQDFYHRWNRPQEYGTMNGQPTRFNTFKRTRKQEPIQLQICCSDFEQFDPLDLVRTQLGWGEIITAKYSDPQEQLTLELLHD